MKEEIVSVLKTKIVPGSHPLTRFIRLYTNSAQLEDGKMVTVPKAPLTNGCSLSSLVACLTASESTRLLLFKRPVVVSKVFFLYAYAN